MRHRNQRGRYYGLSYGSRRRGTPVLKTMAAVVAVLVLAGGLGVFAYKFTESRLEKRERIVMAPEAVREAILQQVGPKAETIEGIRSLLSRSGIAPMDWEERAELSRSKIEPEEIRVIWMEDFVDTRTPTEAKGIYVTAAGAQNNLDNLLALVERTELNAMVIDIKDDDGRITYQMDYEIAKEIGATRGYITNIESVVKKLKEHGVYMIARIVAFKDPVLANAKPELALKNQDGTIFRDKDGQAWVNPYKKEVWEYLVGVAKAAGEIGFDEVNFDYIRFSTDSGMSSVDFGEEAKEVTKMETITAFVKYACEQLRPCGLYISADVYGAIIPSRIDAEIVGQSYTDMSRYLDYICPMVYPSHYGDGYYGLDHPDMHPYELIYKAMQDSVKKIELILPDEHRAKVRPWLQDFTASWLKYHLQYGAEELREQIDAVYDSGYSEWLLWNGAMNYTESGLLTEEEAAVEAAQRESEKAKENETTE